MPYLMATLSNVSPALTVCFLAALDVVATTGLAPANLYSSSSVPLKMSISTEALMPLTTPFSLYCQIVQLNQPRGKAGCIASTY